MGNTAWERYQASMPSEEDTKRRAAEKAASLKAKIAEAEAEMARAKPIPTTMSVSGGSMSGLTGQHSAAKAVEGAVEAKVRAAEKESPAPMADVPEEKLKPLPEGLDLGSQGPRVVGHTQAHWEPTTISEQTSERQIDPKLQAQSEALQRSGAKSGMESAAAAYQASVQERTTAGQAEALKASALTNAAERREEQAAAQKSAIERRVSALDQMMKDIDTGVVDTEKAWNSRSDTWPIIGMLILTAATGGNVVDVIRTYDDRIKSRIAGEQAELDRRNKLGLAKMELGDNLVGRMLEVYKREDEALIAAETLQFKALDAQIARAMIRAGSPKDRAMFAAARQELAGKLAEQKMKMADATAASYQRSEGQKFVPPQPIFSRAPQKIGSPAADKLSAEFYEKLQKRGANDAYADLDAVLNSIPDGKMRDNIATVIGSGKYGDAAAMIGQYFHSNPNALAAATEYMNSYIHEMTGAQMGVQEVGRYFAAAGHMTAQGFANFVTRRGGRLDDISDQVAASMGPQRGVIARKLYNISHHNARVYRRSDANYGRALPTSSGEAKRVSP